MPSMKAVKRRIGSVKNIQQIMKAMKLVATSKVQRFRVKMDAVKPMFDEANNFVQRGITHQDAMDSPYYQAREVKKVAYVVITGERGLCGSYNSNILKESLAHMNQNAKSESVITLGAKGREYFVRRDKKHVAEYKGILENVSYKDAEAVAKQLVNMYNAEGEDRVDEVYLAYTQFETLLSHVPTVTKLLPLGAPDENTEAGGVEVDYEPDVLTYLDKAVPVYLTMLIYGAMTQASVCEQAARMTSMDSASRNAEELVDKLTLQYNRQRQGAITQEISEIVGGANAI